MTLMQIFLGTLIFTPIFLAMLDKFLKAKQPSDSGKTLSENDKILLEKLGENYERNPYIRRRKYLEEIIRKKNMSNR